MTTTKTMMKHIQYHNEVLKIKSLYFRGDQNYKNIFFNGVATFLWCTLFLYPQNHVSDDCARQQCHLRTLTTVVDKTNTTGCTRLGNRMLSHMQWTPDNLLKSSEGAVCGNANVRFSDNRHTLKFLQPAPLVRTPDNVRVSPCENTAGDYIEDSLRARGRMNDVFTVKRKELNGITLSIHFKYN